MNSKVKGIIICTVVAACLGGTMLFLNKQGDGKGGNSSESSAHTEESSHNHEEEEQSLVVLNRKSEEIKSVEVKNPTGGYTLENPLSGKANIVIDELRGVNQNDTLVKNLLDNTANLEAEKIAEENPSGLEKYGLKDPKTRFTVEYTDSTKKTVLIGDESVDGKSRYFMLENDSRVYMGQLSKLAYYTNDYTEFASNEMFPSQEDDAEYGKLTVTRSDLNYNITFEQDSTNNSLMASAQVMTSPVFAYLDVNDSTNITHGMWGLTAAGCETVKPDKKTLKKYGLDKPVCTVNFKGEGYDYTLKVGNPIYGSQSDTNTVGEKEIYGYYCTAQGNSGTDCIYKVSASSLPWVSMNVNDIKSNIIIARFLMDMEYISFSGEENSKFDIESTASGEDNGEVKKVSCDGKELDCDSFKTLYQDMISCPSAEICFDEPVEKNKYLTIKLHTTTGDEQVLEFYKDSSRRTIMKNNGKTSYRIETSWVQSLIEKSRKIKAGKSIS